MQAGPSIAPAAHTGDDPQAKTGGTRMAQNYPNFRSLLSSSADYQAVNVRGDWPDRLSFDVLHGAECVRDNQAPRLPSASLCPCRHRSRP
jgi:hypothetical protein